MNENPHDQDAADTPDELRDYVMEGVPGFDFAKPQKGEVTAGFMWAPERLPSGE
jgi:hypothetical protein